MGESLSIRKQRVFLCIAHVCIHRSACYLQCMHLCVCVYVSNLSHSNRVLRMSDDLSLGKVHWDLALCLLFAWVICYFCIWKGIKSTGKVSPCVISPFLCLYLLTCHRYRFNKRDQNVIIREFYLDSWVHLKS